MRRSSTRKAPPKVTFDVHEQFRLVLRKNDFYSEAFKCTFTFANITNKKKKLIKMNAGTFPLNNPSADCLFSLSTNCHRDAWDNIYLLSFRFQMNNRFSLSKIFSSTNVPVMMIDNVMLPAPHPQHEATFDSWTPFPNPQTIKIPDKREKSKQLVTQEDFVRL